MTALATEIPGYLTGTWTIDPGHSNVTFSIRHMMVSKVRGSFGEFSGSIVTADSLTDSSVSAEIARQDFGVSWNAALETGGAVVSDKVKIELDIQAVLEVPQV